MTNSIELHMLSKDFAKQNLRCAKQALQEPSVLEFNKLKIKIVENKTAINKNYLYLFMPHLFVPFFGYILNWLYFADLPAILSLQISKMLKF